MKKITSIAMIAILLGLHIQLPSQLPCANYHRQAGCSLASEEGFRYNSQSRSGLFARGTTSKLKAVFYSGFDYSITICPDASLGTDIQFTLTDALDGTVIYDNATDSKSPHMEFSCETTRNMFITVIIPGGAAVKKGQSQDGACLGILIEQMVTPKVGF
jgi:hypothetical protein